MGTEVKNLDPFRGSRAVEIGDRFQQLKDAHRAQEEMHWFGSLVIEFDPFELEILRDMGLLAIRDVNFLAKHEQRYQNSITRERTGGEPHLARSPHKG